MAHGAAADERLGHLGHGDGALHAGGDAELFQRILQGQRVDDGGQHAHVIAGGALDAALAAGQAAENIAAADHHHDLHAQVAHLADLLGHVLHRLGADAHPVSPPRASPLSLSRIRLYLGCFSFFMALHLNASVRKTVARRL